MSVESEARQLTINSVTISGSLKVAKNSLAFYEGGKMDSKGLQNGQRLPSPKHYI